MKQRKIEYASDIYVLIVLPKVECIDTSMDSHIQDCLGGIYLIRYDIKFDILLKENDNINYLKKIYSY